MQVTITANALKSMLLGFTKVMSGKNRIPALDCACIEKTANGEVTLTVTNLSESLAYSLLPETQTSGDGHGVFLCSVPELKKAAAGLKKDDRLVLSPNGDEAVRITTFTGGQAITREIGSIAAAEFPAAFQVSPEFTPCNPGAFLAAYRTAQCAAATDESRRALHCIYADAAEAAVVATDGRRMMKLGVQPFPLEQSLLIPQTKVLANVILNAAEGFFGVVNNASCAILEIRAAPWRYQVKCAEVCYPNYKQVIPNDRAKDAMVQIAEGDIPLLKTAISQLVNPGNGSISLLAHTEGFTLFGGKPGADGAFPQVTLPNSKTASGHALLTLNAEFLMDAIQAGFRQVRLPQEMSPLKFRLPDGGESVYVLMPMRDTPEGLPAYAHSLFPNSVPKPEAEPETTTQVPEPTNNEETETMKSQTSPNPEHETTATAEADANAAEAVVPPVIPFPTSTDPIQELIAELNGIQDNANEVLIRLKTLRQKARNVERHYRSRAKEIEAKSQLIAKFQKAVSL